MATGVVTDDLSDLVAAVEAWDGDAETARALRERLRELEPPRRAPAGVAERVVLKLRSAYGKRSAASLGGWLRDNPEEAALAGPFIGDGEMGDWPFADARRVGDEAAITWLTVLARIRVVVDEPMRELVRVMFRTRPRETWLPASRAFAALARFDGPLRDELEAHWSAWLGKGWPGRWPGGRLAARPGADAPVSAHDADDAAHLLRHVAHLGCAWLARGGDPALVGGLTPARVAATPLPSADDSDASAVLLGLVELVRGEGRAAVLPSLPARAGEVGAQAMSEHALRELADALAGADDAGAAAAHAALLGRLATRRWHEAPLPEQPGALLEWLRTARQAAERGEGARLDEMRAQESSASAALALATGADPGPLVGDPVEAVVERLRHLTSPLLRATTLPARRAPMLAELVHLLGHPVVAGVDWPALVERALGPEAAALATPGGVGGTAADDLPALLVAAGLPLAWLLRPARMTRTTVMRVAASPDTLVSRQVAVQVERLMREAPSADERLRILWDLLRANPPSETFRQLRLVLRRGEQALIRLVQALEALDEARDAAVPPAALAAPFAAVVSAAREVLEEGGKPDAAAPGAACLTAMSADAAGALAGLPPDPTPPEALVAALARLLLGETAGTGLVAWVDWLEGPAAETAAATAGERREAVAARVRRLEQALGALRDALPAVEPDQHDALARAAGDLRAALARLGWPESTVAEALLTRVEAWAADRLADAAQGHDLALHVRAALDRGDDDEAARVAADPEALRLLPAGVARRLHAFLLDHLLLDRAQAVRRELANRVHLPHALAHLAPLGAGVVGGTLLVLDVGEGWLGLIEQRAWWAYALTVCLSLLASYGLLFGDLALGIRSGGGDRKVGRRLARRMAGRVLGIFGRAWALALASSAVVMATLGHMGDGKPAGDVLAELLLFSGLSVFLGVFVGLILQGRRTRTEG